MKYKNIILDFDGTLADTAAMIVETMQRTIKALNLPPKTDAECREMIGYRLEDMSSHLWPELHDESERFVTTYREIYNTIKDSFEVNMFPHVAETLKELHGEGINMAVASSRSHASLRDYCSRWHILDYFKMLVGSGDVKHGKPAPDPVNLILSTEGWNKEETLTVGDMNVDILMGKGAGTATCGVTYGNGTIAELQAAGADHIISDFADLLKL